MTLGKRLPLWAHGIMWATAFFIHLGLGISEAVVLGLNPGAQSSCAGAIWTCLLVKCIFHFIAVLTWYNDVQNAKAVRDGHDDELMCGALFSVLAGFTRLGLGIWAAVLYFNTDCADEFKREYVDVWNCLFVEVILLFVNCTHIFIEIFIKVLDRVRDAF